MMYKIGDSAEISKKFTSKDVSLFSELSKDVNPIHLDEDYAKNTVFKRKICHGFLVGSLISAVLGNKLPGKGAIYLGQKMNFISPVFIDDTITAKVEISEVSEKKDKEIIRLKTICINQFSKVVIEGDAVMMMYK